MFLAILSLVGEWSWCACVCVSLAIADHRLVGGDGGAKSAADRCSPKLLATLS